MRKTNRLGCLSGTGILAALLTAILIAGYAYAKDGLLYNPGPLNAQSGEMLGGVTSHAQTGGDCKACHTAPWESETMSDRCANCHGGIAGQMRDVASLHGKLLHDDPNLSCRHCHPEHRGVDAPLTLMDTREFPHEAVGYSLQGHGRTTTGQPFACDDCHGTDITVFALDTCRSCHSQIDPAFGTAHSISYGNVCLDCHDGVDRFGGGFNHATEFALDGGHAEVACVKCHFDARGLADFENAPSDCYSCHQRDDEHGGRFGTDCAGCHNTSDWEDATFDHNQSNFPLTGRHVNLECDQCHTSGQFAGLSTNCVSCHADPVFHAGMFGSDCAACHTANDWFAPFTGSHPAIADEEGTGVNHGNTSCRTCHTQNLSSATCLACHDSNNPDDGGGGEGGEGGD
jgi:hypothetical protein